MGYETLNHPRWLSNSRDGVLLSSVFRGLSGLECVTESHDIIKNFTPDRKYNRSRHIVGY